MKAGVILRIIIIAFLIALLFLIRKYQTALFYDPFTEYFAIYTKTIPIPDYDFFKMYSNIMLRYVMNSTISVAIIYCIFLNKEYTISAVKIYAIAGLVFLFLYALMIENDMPLGEMPVFYVRRFLIQPLLLIILVPAFYYQQFTEKQVD